MRSIKDYKPEPENNADAVSELSGKYDGLSQDELMSELFRTVSSAKSDGTFSAAQLDEFVGFVSPSLDEQSSARLRELVKMIKNA